LPKTEREQVSVYLTASGGMVVGGGSLDPHDAAVVIEMVAGTKMKGT
jgi:hypothetical protein